MRYSAGEVTNFFIDLYTWTCQRWPVIQNLFVRTLDVVWKTYRERWMIGTDGERVREICADNNDDDDDHCQKIDS